jgi:P-type Cu2+ transporter
MSVVIEASDPAVRGPRRVEKPPTPTKPLCRHCGAPLLDARTIETGFCCAGCSYVFRLVHEHRLAGYYRIKDEITAPADAAVFQLRDYAWLADAQAAAEALGPAGSATPAGIPELTLDVQGISCAGCVWLIERLFQQRAGARDIFVNAQYGSMRLRWLRGEFSAVDFARQLQGFGYIVGPAGEAPEEPESRALVKRIGLCAAFAMNVMLFSLPVYFGMERTFEWAGLFGVLSLAFGTLSLLVGGLYFLGRAVQALRARAMHIDLPIAIGIAGAYAGSLYGWLAGEERFVYFDFVSAFILLMLIGRWAQVAAVERNRRRLLSQQPRLQRLRLANGSEVRPEKLQCGETFMLRPGQTLPVEARLDSAQASFSLASINGEAEPRLLRAGQRVPAGALSLNRGEVHVVALQGWRDSLLAQLLQVRERGSATHAFLEKIVRGYVVGILVVAALSGAGWWLATADAPRTWAVVTAVLVVSCPCAIALAFPLADEMATVALRRRGVFVREADLWPKLARVRKLIFDKTGTLTLETPVLQNPETLLALDAAARAALTALVRDSAHPISQCLLENLLAADASELASVPAGEVAESIGFGVELGPWSLGRPGWRAANGAATNLPGCPDAGSGPSSRDAWVAAGPTPGVATTRIEDVVFAREGTVVAQFRFADTARPDARAELLALAARGFDSFILSGDRREKVASLAVELGLPASHAFGELTPQGKADWLHARGAGDALMLGDGANDSLAFDCALCRGTPVIHRGVLERKADFYYLGRGIGGLRALFEVDAIRRRTHLVILVFSIAYNTLAVGLAVAGRMNPLFAAALMPINSLLTLALVTYGMRRVFRR